MTDTVGLPGPAPGLRDRLFPADVLVAVCICAAAVLYWTWDNRTSPIPAPAPPPVIAPAQRALSDELNNDGSRLYAAANYSEAEARFRKAISANPQSALGYSNLGAVLIPQRRYDDAIAALEKAIALDPSLALARNNLAWAQQEKAKRSK